MFAYCGNNPTSRRDTGGNWFDTVLDLFSLGSSIADVISNPSDPWAWVGLVGDIVDVVVPYAGGLGEAIDTLRVTNRLIDGADGAIDTIKAADKAEAAKDLVTSATTGSPNAIGKIGEQLAGIDPSAKVSIQINGRTRIPDALTDTTLTEVKNVKYISNTRQLRDFADYANATGRTLELYVRPTTKVAQTVIDAGWNINYLW